MPARVSSASGARPRGRPSKFGQPARLVALTLPQSVVRGLQRIDPDIGWAIVRLLEKRAAPRRREPPKDVDLVLVGARQALIIVNPATFMSLPGIAMIPFGRNQAFLALEPGSSLADLELAAIDRLDGGGLTERERKGLLLLRRELRQWRSNPRLRFRARAILVAESMKAGRRPRR